MAKKIKTTKAGAPAKKSRKAKPEQLKIAGTERLDAIKEIEQAADAYRDARDERMQEQEAESDAQERLTDLLRKHGLSEYVYEAKDGKKYRAYVPAAAGAKVQRIKDKVEKTDEAKAP